ncbi:MAG TPA: phosphohistidine phosphatase SixA [Chthonomonadaceae bacterium]|nr:phosphohistidine phosphatase SixA [Chthonomonadaceae bacterium]
MHLYFLRHGAAEEHHAGQRDADRHLTSEGRAEMQAAAAGLAALDPRIDAIYSSPLARALETAQIAAKALGLREDKIRLEERLAAGNLRLGSLQSLLASQPSSARILLVGHEPDFSMVVGQLIGGGAVEIKRGGLARVEAVRLEPGGGVLRWLLTPQHLFLRSQESR